LNLQQPLDENAILHGSVMPIAEVFRLCPHAIFLSVNMNK